MRQQDHWKEHADFMDRLAEERFILAGGPVGEGRREGAMHIVEADSARDIRNRLEADPWVRMGLLVVASIEPWTILLGAIR